MQAIRKYFRAITRDIPQTGIYLLTFLLGYSFTTVAPKERFLLPKGISVAVSPSKLKYLNHTTGTHAIYLMNKKNNCFLSEKAFVLTRKDKKAILMFEAKAKDLETIKLLLKQSTILVEQLPETSEICQSKGKITYG